MRVYRFTYKLVMLNGKVMKKSKEIVGISLILTIVLIASALAFLNNQRPTTNDSTTPTPTPTPTLKPTSSATPSSTAIAGTQFTYSVENTYPHNTNAFTEGLVYSDGYLFESTGLLEDSSGNILGPSSLRQEDLATGNIIQQTNLSLNYFGEGMTIVDNTIIQLTWQTNIGFIYDKNTFTQIGNFTYPTEGWGLTYNGSQLIMSDGTDNLYFLNPTTFQRTGQVQVHDGSTSVVNINELEFVNGDIYANIWLTNKIAIINPQTGQVKAWIDLTGLSGPTNPNADSVLNGIAYDQQNNRLYVTGKEWPNLYQIKLIPQN
jgi:glutaminyl-peptide cyclotransferase